MGSRRPTWLVLIVLHFTACLGEPPKVGGSDTGSADDTTGTSESTTGQSASEPVGGESVDPTATSVASASADDGDPQTGSDEEGPDSTDAEGGSDTTGHAEGSSSDEGSSGDTSGASTTGEPVWTCDLGFYDGDDGCDCGCGLFDPDCADATVDSCEFCSNEGSCSFELNCPGFIDPNNNAVCN